MQTPFEVKDSFSFPNLPGIYKFTNKANGKIYFGKSVKMNKRMINYRRDLKRGLNRPILSALRKYGWDGFILEVLEEYDVVDNNYLLSREAELIQIHSANVDGIGYNLCAFGADRSGCKLTEEHKRKIGATNAIVGKGRVMSAEFCRKNSERMKNRIVSDEDRRKMSLGVRKLFSDPQYKKNFNARMLKSRQKGMVINQISLEDGSIVKVWEMVIDIMKEFPKITHQSIKRCFDKKISSLEGFGWEKVKNSDLV